MIKPMNQDELLKDLLITHLASLTYQLDDIHLKLTQTECFLDKFCQEVEDRLGTTSGAGETK